MTKVTIPSHVNVGRLQVGQIIRMPFDRSLWEVITANDGSALVRALFGRPAKIKTRKGLVKDIMRRPPDMRISSTSVVDVLDFDPRRPEDKTMATQNTYVRTEKAIEKEIKGQGLIVLQALEARGGSATAEQLAEDTMTKFVGSKQPSVRIVKFYMAKYTRQGYLRKVAPEPAPAAAPAGEPVAEPITA